MTCLSLRHWFPQTACSSRSVKRASRTSRPRTLPRLEALEARCVPSTVTNLNDAGPGSLRDAIAMTPAGGTVDFEPGLAGTITLTSGGLGIDKELTIAGPGADVLTVSGGDRGGVFGIASTGIATIEGLTMAHGLSYGEGGAIANRGTLTLRSCTVRDSFAIRGAGVSNFTGTLTVIDSTFVNNLAEVNGGGIYNYILAPTVETVINSTFTGNAACAISGYPGLTVIATDSTFSGNESAICNAYNPTILRNNILAGNQAGGGQDVSGPIDSQGYNLIGDGSRGTGFTATDLVGTSDHPIDPLLGPLQDNGGSTPTMALLPGSPALNTGDPDQLGSPDQRGVVRTGGVNIGAYQASATAFVVGAPAKVTAGVPFDVTVMAVDPFGQVAVGYTGTVTFSTTDPDPGVVLPADYSFTLDDGGVHTFTGETTLQTRGPQALTVTDTADGSIQGSVTVKVKPNNTGETPSAGRSRGQGAAGDGWVAPLASGALDLPWPGQEQAAA